MPLQITLKHSNRCIDIVVWKKIGFHLDRIHILQLCITQALTDVEQFSMLTQALRASKRLAQCQQVSRPGNPFPKWKRLAIFAERSVSRGNHFDLNINRGLRQERFGCLKEKASSCFVITMPAESRNQCVLCDWGELSLGNGFDETLTLTDALCLCEPSEGLGQDFIAKMGRKRFVRSADLLE